MTPTGRRDVHGGAGQPAFGLTAGSASSVEVTITDSGAQQQQRTEPLTAAFENVPSEHDGTAFTFDLTLSEAPDAGNLRWRPPSRLGAGKASVSGSGTQYTVTVTPKPANAWKDVRSRWRAGAPAQRRVRYARPTGGRCRTRRA